MILKTKDTGKSKNYWGLTTHSGFENNFPKIIQVRMSRHVEESRVLEEMQKKRL